MAEVRVDQLLHGYRRGHQLLAGSVRLDTQAAELVSRLSDLSGLITKDIDFKPYLTAYPLPGGEFYALAKTWLDEQAPRDGCVITHTLLIPIKAWGHSSNPEGFTSLFSLPSSTKDVVEYQNPHHCDLLSLSSQSSLEPPSRLLTLEFVAKYFGEGLRPLIWFDEANAEDAYWLLQRALWPRLRQNFACCTFSLQPRALENRPFDLLFASSKAYSRFSKIPRENFLDPTADYEDSLTYEHDGAGWYIDWANSIFYNDSKGVFAAELKELGPLLGDDPTAVRSLFLIDSLKKRLPMSPTASVGLMDVVESLAPKSDDARDYKNDLVQLALESARSINDPSEALKCFFLISERLDHPAFAEINSDITLKISSSVASQTYKAPETALSVGERLFTPYHSKFNSPYTKGVMEGLLQLTLSDPDRLHILHRFPVAAVPLIESNPSIAPGYLCSLRLTNSTNTANTDLVSWIGAINDPDVSKRVCHALLPQIQSDDEAKLAEVILQQVDKGDVLEVFDILAESTDHFSGEGIRQVVCERLAQVYPELTRKWANHTNFWSQDVAAVVAATYPGNANGFKQLLQSPFNRSFQRAQIITAFLEMVTKGNLPVWFRDYAQHHADFLIPLLANGPDTSLDTLRMLAVIINNVREMPIASELELIDSIGCFQSYEFGEKLVDLALRSAIGGYIAGDINSKVYEAWQEAPWASSWFEQVDRWDLKSLLTNNSYRDQEAWGRALAWVAKSPDTLFRRSPSILAELVESLIGVRRWNWDWNIHDTESWVRILNRAHSSKLAALHLQLSAYALDFALNNVKYPLSKLVVESFWRVYKVVADSSDNQRKNIIYNIITWVAIDWDKAKDLRRKLVDSFLMSNWPPGDLALAVRDYSLLRKVFKRIMRRSAGAKYIDAMYRDLMNKDDQRAPKVLAQLTELMKDPHFHEPWD